MISTELHAKVIEEKERLEMNTLGDYMEMILKEHFKGGKLLMEATKTFAIQLPAELIDRLQAYPIDPEWRMNITTEDIVYPFVDCTKTVYRKKTIELKAASGITTTVTAISEIKYQKNGAKAERTLSDAEFSVAQFEAMKEWSDAEYKKQVRSYVQDNRKSVARVDDLEDCPAIAFYEKLIGLIMERNTAQIP